MVKSPTEITIAGSFNGIEKIYRRAVSMTTHMNSTIMEAMIAGEKRVSIDDAFLKASDPL